jgi:hypothetical protein
MEHIDAYTAQMLIYRAEMYILMKYPYLIDINKKNGEVNKTLTDKSFFYIIKSFSEEDVHKVSKELTRLLNIMFGHQQKQETRL